MSALTNFLSEQHGTFGIQRNIRTTFASRRPSLLSFRAPTYCIPVVQHIKRQGERIPLQSALSRDLEHSSEHAQLGPSSRNAYCR